MGILLIAITTIFGHCRATAPLMLLRRALLCSRVAAVEFVCKSRVCEPTPVEVGRSCLEES